MSIVFVYRLFMAHLINTVLFLAKRKFIFRETCSTLSSNFKSYWINILVDDF